MAPITLHVNGRSHTVDVPPETPLLWVLRDELGLTGTKYSCGIGICGSCTVHVDGEPLRSCSTPVREVGDRPVRTIEALAVDGLHPVQRAWIEEQTPQCGYCHPGQIMAAVALLETNPRASDREIVQALSGNLCRCGTYQRILAAVRRAQKEVAP